MEKPYIPSDADNPEVIHAKFAFEQFLDSHGLKEEVRVDTLDFIKYHRDHAGGMVAVNLDTSFGASLVLDEDQESDFGERLLVLCEGADLSDVGRQFAVIGRGVTPAKMFRAYYETIKDL